jgi:predicted Zn-dependent protease
MGLFLGTASWAFPIMAPQQQPGLGQPDSPLLLEMPTPPGAAGAVAPMPGDTGRAALNELSGGRWARACEMAAMVLARKVPDIDALGLFGVCRAAVNDRTAAESALKRLHQAEGPPHYALLVQGVLDLNDKAPDKALSVFKAALQARPGDPLTVYFTGEALHAGKQDAEAIASFKAVLKAWPRFTPAMTAAARVMAKPDASPQQLKEALAMAEKATAIEPMNRGYWRLLADLCNRTGQKDRANAITLQWLTPPPLPK